MDTDSFLIHIKTEDFYENIANDLEKGFDTSDCNEDTKRRPSIGKNKKVIGLFKDELEGMVMKEFVGLRAKAYAYLMDDDSEHKNAKGTKKCVTKGEPIFKNYKDALFNDKIILKSQQRFKSDYHNVFTKKSNKIALMMIRDYKNSIKLQHIHMEQTHLK